MPSSRTHLCKPRLGSLERGIEPNPEPPDFLELQCDPPDMVRFQL